MSAASSTPARPPSDRVRFDKGRATLSLLLLSAVLLGLLALGQSGRLPQREGRAFPSVWDGIAPPNVQPALHSPAPPSSRQAR